MAYLETVVHLDGAKALPLNRYLVQIEVPDDVWTSSTLFDATKHVGWDALPAGKTSIDFGTHWSASMASLLALVPSVVIPEEMNILINPRHADMGKLTAAKIRRWTYNHRTRVTE